MFLERPRATADEVAQRADVLVAHGRVGGSPGTGKGIATAAGTAGAGSEMSNKAKPSASCALAIRRSGCMQRGHVSRDAAEEREKRSRQLGQQAWVITTPSYRRPNHPS
jgi:hypothetical protein